MRTVLKSRSVSLYAHCKLSQWMEATDGTITEDDKEFVVRRLQRELQHTGVRQYNCEDCWSFYLCIMDSTCPYY